MNEHFSRVLEDHTFPDDADRNFYEGEFFTDVARLCLETELEREDFEDRF